MDTKHDMVVVDDSSTEQISYSDGWIERVTVSDIMGGVGPPLYQTLHVATSLASFTFTFNAPVQTLMVFGLFANKASLTAWNCTLDNQTMSDSHGSINVPTNHAEICWSAVQTFPVRTHTMRISVMGSVDNPVYFDYILYSLNTSTWADPGDRFIYAADGGIRYNGPGWKQGGPTGAGMTTTNPGDSLELNFTGHTVSWVGFFSAFNAYLGKANAVYSIDGSNPVEFTFQNTAGLTQQVFFQTLSLPEGPGQHHLQVTYNGPSGISTPLALDHLIIQNSTTDFPLPLFPDIQVNAGQTTPEDNILNDRASLHINKVVGISVPIFVVICVALVYGWKVRKVRKAWSARDLWVSSQFARPFPARRNLLPPILPRGKERHWQQSPNTSTTNAERQSAVPIATARASKARRLAEVRTATVRQHGPQTPMSPPELIFDAPTTTNARPSRVVIHQDGGVHLPQPDEEEAEIIEVPPAYASIR